MRDSLDWELIRAALVTSGRPWQDVEFHPSIGSTNSRAAELATSPGGTEGSYAAGLGAAPSALWRVVLTDDQTGGRGRLGRVWQVPARASVAVSAVVPAPAPSEMGWVPLLAGVALARAVEQLAPGAGPRLKWPNDVLLSADGDRKVAGILCELVSLVADGSAVVIGTGVNVDQSRDELPVETATSLRMSGARVRREDLVVAYLTELAGVLTGDRAGLRAELRDEYRRRCATVGSEVRVHLPGGRTADGEAVGIDASGAVVVRRTSPGGGSTERSFAAGDVVHLRPGGLA